MKPTDEQLIREQLWTKAKKAEIGATIEGLRKESGIKRFNLAKQGMHQTAVVSIESGQTNYTIEILLKELYLLGLDIEIKRREK